MVVGVVEQKAGHYRTGSALCQRRSRYRASKACSALCHSQYSPPYSCSAHCCCTGWALPLPPSSWLAQGQCSKAGSGGGYSGWASRGHERPVRSARVELWSCGVASLAVVRPLGSRMRQAPGIAGRYGLDYAANEATVPGCSEGCAFSGLMRQVVA